MKGEIAEMEILPGIFVGNSENICFTVIEIIQWSAICGILTFGDTSVFLYCF